MDLCLEAKQSTGPRVATRCWEQEGLDFEGIWTETRTEEHAEGGIGNGWDVDGNIQQIKWEDTVKNTTLGMEPNAPLAYSTVLKIHQPNMSTLGAHRGQLDREIEIKLPFQGRPFDNWHQWNKNQAYLHTNISAYMHHQ